MANEFKVKKGLIVEGSGGTILDIQGSVGQLFSITDSLTGDLFAVSDISGIPILNVNSSGAVDIDGDLSVTDDVTLSNFGAGYLKTNVNGVVSNTATIPWATVSSTPTTISGYGITDALAIGTTATTAMAGDTAIPSATDILTLLSTNNIVDWTTDQGSTNIHSGNYNNTQLSNAEVISAIVASSSIDNADKGTIRSNIGAGTSSFDGAYSSLSGTPTLGTAAAAATGDFVSSGGNDTITHATNQSGLGIYTSGGAVPTVPQLQVGRGSSQYWGVMTADHTATLIHRQDETGTETPNTQFQIWASSTGTAYWSWSKATNAGASPSEKMKLTDGSALTLGGGSNTITNTKVGQWDTAYTDRNKWDGGSTGLTASTGRTSLGLGTAATAATGDFATAAQGTTADAALPKAGGTMTGALVAPRVSLTLDTGNNVNSRVTVYESGATSYGMMLWNDNATSGDWATMIYGPNQDNRKISFGKANSNFPGTKASVDELAYVDLDNGNFVATGTLSGTNFSGSSSGTNTGDQDLSSYITSQRAISSTPTDGATTTAISSDWAFDNVKTAVPANALFTDANTQLSQQEVLGMLTAGANITITTDGEISATDTDTVYTHPTGAGNKHIPSGGSAGEFLRYSSSGTAVWATPSYTTNTNTTYSAGTGLDLTGTTFSVETDLRDGITHVGKDTSNFIQFDSTEETITFIVGGNAVAVMESDGDLHIKGDVIAFSDIFNP